MRRETHNQWAKMLLGDNVKMKTIDAVNGAIDNPTKQDKIFRNLYNANEFDFLGLLEKGSHRQYNHDPLYGMMKALSIDPNHGVEAYLAHAMLDRLSNDMRISMGSDKRDILEVYFHRTLADINKKKVRKKKKNYSFLKNKRLSS